MAGGLAAATGRVLCVAGRARVGRQPVRGRAAAAGRAPVAVRRRAGRRACAAGPASSPSSSGCCRSRIAAAVLRTGARIWIRSTCCGWRRSPPPSGQLSLGVAIVGGGAARLPRRPAVGDAHAPPRGSHGRARAAAHARPGQLRRSGLARRHGVRAAAMTATARRFAVRRALRALSSVMIVAGAILLADAAATLLWQEPVSAVYAHFQQNALDDDLSELEQAPLAPAEQRALDRIPDPERKLAFRARALQRRLDDGDAMGRILIAEHRRLGGVRRGHRTGRPAQGPGPLPGHAAAGRARHGRDRRPPHHVRRAVPQRRQARARRQDRAAHAVRPLHLPRRAHYASSRRPSCR